MSKDMNDFPPDSYSTNNIFKIWERKIKIQLIGKNFPGSAEW